MGRASKSRSGFMAVCISKTNGLEREFHTTLPCSFLCSDEEHPGQHEVRFPPGPLTDAHYNAIFDLAVLERYKPPDVWLKTSATVYNFYKTYEESQNYIRHLVSEGSIIEPKLSRTSVASVLSSVPALVAGSASTSMPRPVPLALPGQDQRVTQINSTATSEAGLYLQSFTGSGEEQFEATTLDQSFMSETITLLEGQTCETITLHQGRTLETSTLPQYQAPVTNIVHQIQATDESAVTVTVLKDCLAANLSEFSQMRQGFASQVIDALNGVEIRLNALEGKVMETQKIADELRISYGKQNASIQHAAGLMGFTEITKKYQFSVPFKDREEFLVFEEKLNDAFFQDPKTYFTTTTSKLNEPEENILKICHLFFSSAVLVNCVPKQKSGDKIIFGKTKFYTCLLEALTVVYFGSEKYTFSETLLMESVQKVITNGPDWDGGRWKRAQRRSSQSGAVPSPTKRMRPNDENEGTTNTDERVLRNIENNFQE